MKSIYTKKFSKKTFLEGNNTYSYIINHVKKTDKYILDLGCSSGFIGAQIKKKNKQAIVFGADNNKSDIAQAQKCLDKAYLIDLNHFKHQEIDQKFDLIILADIIEHLTSAKQLLKQLPYLLNPKGRILLSIPNFSHYSVVNRMLSQKWKYDKYGILDNTHVKFYNYKSIIKLLESKKFYIQKINLNQSLPEPYVQILELIQNKLPLNFGLYQRIYNPENMVFQYLITFSSHKPKKYQSFLSKKKEILSQYKFPIMKAHQFYFHSTKYIIRSYLGKIRQLFGSLDSK